MGERFREDPFVLFQLRGRSRAKLLQDLAEQRRKVLADISKKSSCDKTEIKSFQALQSHPAILKPSKWWKYKGNLNPDLVVITSNIDRKTCLDAAGELPLAEEPKYPNAREKFINHLNEQGELFSQHAMVQAMNTNV